MEKENDDPKKIPSRNPELNPDDNPEINPSENPLLDPSQNPEINSDDNPDWKKNQWDMFKQTILWDYLNNRQKIMCKEYLDSL